MHIVSSVDDAYAPQCAAMFSALAASHSGVEIAVTLLVGSLSPSSQRRLHRFLTNLGIRCHLQGVDEHLLEGFPLSDHVTLATYYRLTMGDVLPGSIDRVLFLDADLLINGPLDQLWEADLDGRAIGAVVAPDGAEDVERLQMPAGTRYFNAGVMLVDMAAWRAVDVLARARFFLQEHGDRIRWWDQDVLNVLFQNNWQELSSHWNALPQHWLGMQVGRGMPEWRTSKVGDLEKEPAIVHFAGAGDFKPWKYSCGHPYADAYRWHMRRTPWGRQPLDGQPTRWGLLKSRIRPWLVKTGLKRK